MMRLPMCCLLLVFAAVRSQPVANAGDRPLNLLYITADDMNWDSSGWMGSKLGATPALDHWPRKSHRFVHHHVSVPICMPLREAMMTGRVPHRSGGLGFVPIRPGTPDTGDDAQSAGYYTAVINKVAHMKPEAEFPWDDTFTGSGKKPPLLREHFETTLRKAAAAKKPFFINVNIQDPHRPFPGSQTRRIDEDEEAARQRRRASESRGQAPQSGQARRGKNRQPGESVYRPEEVTVPAFLEDIPAVREEVAQYFNGVARFDVALAGILCVARRAEATPTTRSFSSPRITACRFRFRRRRSITMARDRRHC